ncbi:unnamed protein product [Arctia plantaginis]|uniref:snRNA-activating protein complex subunit 4 n=1 Tax=Arctia plantaginis TaxID=874455 RepID=A0A8S1BGF9_ARCPL|nr:unnamed protein product [Arctia plantaginis]
MDWIADTEMEDDDSDTDDENELKRLDAALEEADIAISDTGLPKSSKWVYSTNATHYMASPNASSHSYPEVLIDSVPSLVTATNSVETPGHCYSNSKSQATSLPQTAAPALTNPQLQELSRLNTLLALNKLYDEKLRHLEKILSLRLKNCRTKLDEIQNSSALPEKVEVFRYINCGRPYFRDHLNRSAPDNEDAIMAKAQMYDFSLLTSVPGWTVRDKNHFTNVMTQTSLEIRKEEYNKKINMLKKSIAGKRNKMIEKEISKLRNERDSLNVKLPFIQLALPLDQEYDWDLLANRLNKRHTPHEYRCLWKLYFHPSINKTSWKNSEHSTLQTLASDHHNQDWDEIARKLDTGRTGYQCFVYFRTNMTNTCIGKKWTYEEVTYLRRLIDYFREDVYIPWGKIAAAMENRTKIQIYNKYLRIIEQRKGRFLPEEDAVILNCAERFGPNFKKMTEYLAHRSLVQIRSRFQVLSKMRVSTVWSVEDDRKLVQIMSNQDSNMTFSEATKFFPGRNRVNIRSRYITLIKWMKRNPNTDIELAPRRGARRLNHGQATHDLNKAIENLKNILNTEVAIKKDRRKITRESDEADIEDAIVAALVNEGVKEQESRKSAYDGVLVLPNDTVVTNEELNLTNLHKFLMFLGSKLNRGLYRNSNYKEVYPQLGECDKDVSLIKVKSYSRKNTVKTIKIENMPDVWGNNVLTSRNYVLPPHYATITGCKALMSHVTLYAAYCNCINMHILTRRNSVLKDLMDKLLERFYILFLWPMLLSNEGPQDFNNTKLQGEPSFISYSSQPQTVLPQIKLPQAPEVTIKFNSLKKFKNADVSEVIDLSENESSESTTVPQIFSDENDVPNNVQIYMD